MKVKFQEDQYFWSLKFSDVMWKPAIVGKTPNEPCVFAVRLKMGCGICRGFSRWYSGFELKTGAGSGKREAGSGKREAGILIASGSEILCSVFLELKCEICKRNKARYGISSFNVDLINWPAQTQQAARDWRTYCAYSCVRFQVNF